MLPVLLSFKRTFEYRKHQYSIGKLWKTLRGMFEVDKVEGGEIARIVQLTLASQGSFEKYRKQTRREQFLEEMEQIVPVAGVGSGDPPPLSEGGERSSFELERD